MSAIMILAGPDADADPYLMDLASVAAGVAVASNRRIVFVGTSQTVLAVGTAIVGYQQERTVEGGERARSPMLLAGLVRSTLNTPDPLYLNSESSDETEGNEGGSLSELIDLGIMDLDTRMDGMMIPKPLEDLDFQLDHVLRQEEISQMLVIGSISGETLERLSDNAAASDMRLGCIGVGDAPNGAEVLFSEVGEPRLDGVPIRGVEQSEKGVRGEISSEHLIEAARNASREAGLNHAVSVWVRGTRETP